MNPFKSRNKSIDVSDKDVSFTVYYLGSVPTSFVRSTTSGSVGADLAAASPDAARAVDALWNTFVNRLRDVGLGPEDLLQSHKTMMMPQHRHQLQHQHQQLMRRGGVATPTRLTVCASGLRAVENISGRLSKFKEADENEGPAMVEYRAHRIAHASWHRPATSAVLMTGGNSDRCAGQRYGRRVHYDDIPGLRLRRRLFVWIYRHEVKLMRVEMRCHAVLCKTESAAESIASGLRVRLRSALDEYARERRSRHARQLGGTAASSTSSTTVGRQHQNHGRYPHQNVFEVRHQLERCNSLPTAKKTGVFHFEKGIHVDPRGAVIQHRSCVEPTSSARRRRIINDVVDEFPVPNRSTVTNSSSGIGEFESNALPWLSTMNGCQPIRTRLLSVGRHFKPSVSQSSAASKLGIICEHIDEGQISSDDAEGHDDSDDIDSALDDSSDTRRRLDELDRAIGKKTLPIVYTSGTFCI